MVQDPATDRVLSAIVGAAGLEGTWAALEAGKTVALANKETLVVAGPLVMDLARRRGAEILPVDSEHSAIFQALHAGDRREVRRVILTSSGGPVPGQDAPRAGGRHARGGPQAPDLADGAEDHDRLGHADEQGPRGDRGALAVRPRARSRSRWSIHPESVVHSMVEFVDGSVVAQLSPPDMRLPIQYALTYPDRVAGPCPRLDLTRRHRPCTSSRPTARRSPASTWASRSCAAGAPPGAALNAANEAAVARFLDGEIGFLDIPRACRAALDHHTFDPRPTLDELWKVDAWARQEVARWRP